MTLRCLLLIMGILCAASLGAQPQPQPTPSKNAPKAEKHGTDKNPVSVKIIATPDADRKAAEEEDHRKQKAAEDRRLVDATIWLAWVTTALAFFTALLWFSTYRLAKDARKTADRQFSQTEQSLAIAKKSADAAMILAKADISAEKPILEIVNPELIEYDIHNQPTHEEVLPGAHPRDCYRLRITLKNIGRTPAYVNGRAARLLIMESWPDTLDYGPIVQIDETIAPNVDEPQTLIVTDRLQGTGGVILDAGNAFVAAYGFVTYTDDLTHDTHEIGFSYRWWVDSAYGDPRRGFVREPGRYNYRKTRGGP